MHNEYEVHFNSLLHLFCDGGRGGGTTIGYVVLAATAAAAAGSSSSGGDGDNDDDDGSRNWLQQSVPVVVMKIIFRRVLNLHHSKAINLNTSAFT